MAIHGPVIEIRCDGQEDDKIEKYFTVLIANEDGSEQELTFTLEGARALRDSFDAIPEIDRK